MSFPNFPGLSLLQERDKKGFPKYHFQIGNEIDQIKLLEDAYSILFPDSFRLFLENFDGGMICEYEDHYYIDMTDWEPDGPKESSIYLYSLDEIIDEFRDFRLEDVFLEEGINGKYPFIPIGKTPNQGIIFILSQRGLKEESPVFISYDKDELGKSHQIASHFDAFLNDYLKHEGFPPLKLYKTQGLCSDYLKNKEVLKIAQENESPQEMIKRNTALMQLYPKDSMNYIERANAYVIIGQREMALIDYNKAVELDPEDAFVHYCRGAFVMKYGSKRKALIDFDIAVHLKPKDLFYLNGRSDILFELGMYKKALKDCNTILIEDWRNFLALHTRIKVYRALGDHKKADADITLLNDLNL